MKKHAILIVIAISSLFNYTYAQNLKLFSSQAGLENAILPPWTKMLVQRSDNQINVKCLGRSYIFSQNNFFPSQIISQNVSLLYSPIVLRMSNVKWGNISLKVANQSETNVDISTTANSTNISGLTIACLFHIEYDGLIQVEVKLNNPNKQNINIDNIDIPVTSAVSDYEHRAVSQKAFASKASPYWWHSGGLSSQNGIVDNSDFIPYVWIGNNNVGLFWFCETPVNWPNWTGTNAIQIVRSNSAATLRLNLMVAKGAGPSTWSFKFGLQATPVKPYLANWRNIRFFPMPNPTVSILWPHDDSTATKFFGFPEPKYPNAFRNLVKKYHANNIKLIPYSCLTLQSTAQPTWSRYWDLGIRNVHSEDVKTFNAPFVRTNPLSQSYSNFIIQKNKDFLDNYNVDGFYLDGTGLININVRHSIKNDKDSTKSDLPYYPILSLRKTNMRLYSVVKNNNPNNIIVAHTSTSIVPPILAYVDAYVDGEQFRDPRRHVEDSYTDILSLDEFRTEFLGKQFGVVPVFLPEFSGVNSRAPGPTDNLISLLLVHDVLCWPVSGNLDEWKKVYAILDKYKYTNAEFIPYYSKTPPNTSPIKGIYVSMYKLDTGKLLIIAANLSKNKVSGNVTINSAYNTKGNFSIKKLPNGNAVATNSNSFFVSLDPSQYDLFILE